MSARAGSGLRGLRALLAFALLAWASAIGWAGHACAQSELVLLLVPQTPDPALVELFHRVEAELRLHDFRPEVLVASPGDSTEALLGAQASAQRAFAAIAIAEQAPAAMLHVWIVDARTGLTRQYQVEQRGGQEPTNVVAVRAVDLLRAHRALSVAPGTAPPSAATSAVGAGAVTGTEPKAGHTEPNKPAGAASPDPQKPAALRAGATERESDRSTGSEREGDRSAASEQEEERDDERSEPEYTGGTPTFHYKPTILHIAAEATAISLGQRMGWSFGPSLGAWLTLGDRWRVGVVGAAPLWGAALHARLGEPKIVQELVWAELGARLVRTGILQLSAAAGFGVHWLQAYGRAVPPYRSQDASTWSWTGSLTARADVMLAQDWSLGVSVRARMFLPPVEIAVEDEAARLATPAIEGGLGLSYWL